MPPASTPWHALAGDEVLARLSSSRDGLPADEAARRLRAGANELPERRRRTLAAVFLAQFASPLVLLLVAAAAIAVAVGERGDAAVIVAVLVANAALGTFQEGRAEIAMRSLRRMTAVRARVRRGGEEIALAARELVPGDVLVLAAGDAVAADARVLGAAALETLEAALTGESEPVEKDPAPLPPDTAVADRRDMVHAGTQVAAGRGEAVVVETGAATEVGRIALLAERSGDPRTPLERRVAQLGRVLAVASVAVFAAILAIGVARAMRFQEILLVAVSQLVSTVPEGLPVAMTVALAVGMQRMAARRAIVRRLSAVESLGSTSVICTDKTGTLTRNEMTVVALALPGARRIEVTGVGTEPVGELLEGGRPLRAASDGALAALVEAGALCNDAALAPPEAAGGRWRAAGDPTEVSLLALARKAGLDPDALRRERPRSGEVPFSAATRMMATVHRGPDGELAFLKGAPEVVLATCGSIRRPGGDVPLDAGGRAAILAEAEEMGSRALRVLALAAAPPSAVDPAAPGGRATFLGLVGQLDPPRPEAGAAVRACRDAGIRTVMVTGDHRTTAVAIARALGIAGEGDEALDGRALAEASDAELARVLPRTAVFARVHPEQKLRIVEAFQAAGEIVAVTGDGVNDAPALARADVGVAMGASGTEVAKEASDVVLADDDFATLVRAVEEGRVVYRNVRKGLLLLVSTGIAEIAVLGGALVAGLPLPFAAVQILWNNVVTEGTITVNLAMEPREGDEMRLRPVPRGRPLLDRELLGRMLFLAAVITAVTLGFYAWNLARGVPLERARTATFTLLAVCEWWNVLNCRSAVGSALRLGLGRNPWLAAGLLASNALQIAVVYWRPLGEVFHTVPLPPGDVLAVAAAGSVVLWAEEARKAVVRRRARRS